MVGNGDCLAAECLASTGGTLTGFASADHLAGYAGLAPAPADSGERTGNLHRPRRYNRRLQRVFGTSAMISIQRSPASRAFYDRKRAEGKHHHQAVLALARAQGQRPMDDAPGRTTLRGTASRRHGCLPDTATQLLVVL